MKLSTLRKRLGKANLYEIAPDNGYRAPSGYVHDGTCYCVECAQDIPFPLVSRDTGEEIIHADQLNALSSHDESDSPVTCDVCGILIPSSLTTDGVEHVRESDGRTRYGRMVREAYPWAFRP